VTKQITARWSFIANAVFRIAQNLGKNVTFAGLRWAIAPISPESALEIGPQCLQTKKEI